MATPLRIQVRGPNNKNLRLQLTTAATYSDIVDQIRSSFPSLTEFILHVGIPPKIQEIDGSSPTALLTTLGVRSGDTIIVELGGTGASMVQGSGWDLPPTVDTRHGRVVHYKVPGDNSCLFHSIGAALMRKNPSAQLVTQIKQVIEKEIVSKPKEWTISELGEAPQSYIMELKQQSFWGGAIEIAIISAHYQVEISVVDYAALCITTFAHYPEEVQPGQQATESYKRRIYLMYNGSKLNAAHYDLLVATADSSRASALNGMEAGSAEKDTISHFDSALQSIFRPQDEVALNLVKKLAELSHDRLVREGAVTKRTWTEKDQIKNKAKKPQFTGGKGALGETANVGGHMQYAPTTTPTPTPQPTQPATTTAPTQPQTKPQPTPQPVSTPTPVPTATATATAGAKSDWSCPVCTYSNSYARTLCEMCDTPRPKGAAPAPTPQPVTQPVAQPTTRSTPQATSPTPQPPTKVTPPVAISPTPTRTPTSATATASNRPWTCVSCTYSNRPSAETCAMCEVPRGSSGGDNTSAAKKPNANNNPKPSDVLSKPPNQQQQDDDNDQWQCQSCQSQNDAGASKCRTCNQKKADCNIM